jgi:outer membrane protein W
MRRLLFSSVIAAVLGVVGAPSASAQQSVNLFIGGFTPRSLDARGTDDVLFQNGTFLSTFNQSNGIDIGKFNGATIGGEYLVGLGRNLEAGLGVGFYQRSVPTSYTGFVNTDGTEIAQTLKLRIVPFSATVRFLPIGERDRIQPYIGAGVGVFVWRYSETGQFCDNCSSGTGGNVFTGTFSGSGSEVGPLVLAGVRLPMGPVGVGGEIRWQKAKATLPTDQGFAGPNIDLGGFNYLFTMNFRF